MSTAFTVHNNLFDITKVLTGSDKGVYLISLVAVPLKDDI